MGLKETENQEQIKKDETKVSSLPSLRGLYGKARIPVKTLNVVIIVGCALILILMVYGASNNGYHVSFNTMGGSYIEDQKLYYNDLVEVEEPTRDGYEFDHWALDESCSVTADLETLRVDGDFTLYACWLKK